MSGAWAPWAPYLETPDGGLDLGRGARRVGTVGRVGSLVVAEFSIRFGEDCSAGNGPYLLVPPVAPRPIDEIPRRVGSAQLGDQSDGVRHIQVSITANAVIDDHRFLLSTDGRPAEGRLIVGHDWPWVWERDDFLVGQLSYESA